MTVPLPVPSPAPHTRRPSPFGLDGRTALVVGPDSPSRRGICDGLSDAGAEVCVVMLGEGRDPARLDALGLDAPVDIIVNIAAATERAAIEDVTDAELAAALDRHVRDGYLVGQAAARRFARHADVDGDRTIIHVMTPLARLGARHRALATMCMHALRGLTAAMAVELGPMGVRVNAIEAPAGDRLGEIALAAPPDDEALAAAVVYLASPAARGVTGTSLCLDAGWSAR